MRSLLHLRRQLACAVILGLVGCSDASGTGAPAVPDMGPATDSAGGGEASSPLDTAEAPDAADRLGEVDAGGNASPDAGPVSAADYCEATVGMFCPFYLRCGRMAVPDVAACQPAFLEACNARIEPIWAQLETLGALALSADGLAACAAHLASVPCEAQIFDLDGPCAAVWHGLQPAGAACGPGFESFVCAPGTTCAVDLTFCGTCVAVAATGAACGPDARCGPGDACVQGTCTARTAAGAACAPPVPCVLGATCSAGVCAARPVVGLGEACDAAHRCAYTSACVGGVCRASALLGQPCSATTLCDAGICAAGTCVPFSAPGVPCATADECGPGRCDGGTCAPPAPGCL